MKYVLSARLLLLLDDAGHFDCEQSWVLHLRTG